MLNIRITNSKRRVQAKDEMAWRARKRAASMMGRGLPDHLLMISAPHSSKLLCARNRTAWLNLDG